jgi:predicted GNAT superfamily acetyltransferase
MDAYLLDSASPPWSAAIDEINTQLHAGNNPSLLPNQFLQVVLPKLGGKVLRLSEAGQEVGIGFLLPRGYSSKVGEQGSRQSDHEDNRQTTSHPSHSAYTLRYHALSADGRPTPDFAQAVIQAVTPHLDGAEIYFYDPSAPLHYEATHQEIGSISIGHPNAGEAAQIPMLQKQIWGSSPEFLYPADMHSVEFDLGSSLVARVDGQLAAFLFGFHKFGGPPLPADWTTRFRGDLRLESQTLGVLPDFRGMRIAKLLKQVQGEQAWQQGIGVINWTADPLQFPNAALNFGRLRALAFDFYPNLYPFRNQLNRVPASRFGLTWLVGSERVQNVPLTGGRALMLDLSYHPEVQRVNLGFDELDFEADGDYIAIEIPGNWTEVQQQDEEGALRWRDSTDQLFSHYVGTEPGQYVITGIATDREQHFLIGQKVNDALWEHLGHVAE